METVPPRRPRVVGSRDSAIASFRLLLWKVERRRLQTVVLRVTCDHALETLQRLARGRRAHTVTAPLLGAGAVCPPRTSPSSRCAPTAPLTPLRPPPAPSGLPAAPAFHQRGNRLGSGHLKNIQPVHARPVNEHTGPQGRMPETRWLPISY